MTKNFIKLFALSMITLSLFMGCKKDDPDPPSSNNNTSGQGGGGTTPPEYATIASDPSGDAGGGLDGTKVEFKYNQDKDLLSFRITVTNLNSFASSPSADLSFQLPNGTIPASTESSPFRGNTKTHRTASVYTDALGGIAPSNYTYTSGGYAVNGISLTSDVANSSNGADLRKICGACVDIFVDVPNNQITFSMDRKKIISDQEVGSSKTAVIKLVANTGYKIQNNDLVADGAEFTINIK